MVGHFPCTLNGLFWYIFTELLIFLTDIYALTNRNQTNHYLQSKFLLLGSLFLALTQPNNFSPETYFSEPAWCYRFVQWTMRNFNLFISIRHFSVLSYPFDSFMHPTTNDVKWKKKAWIETKWRCEKCKTDVLHPHRTIMRASFISVSWHCDWFQ